MGTDRQERAAARRRARVERRYVLPDPELRAYDHGVGTLAVDGVVEGYLASVVGTITFPSRSPWPWFVVVWADGTKEPPFEDYGPGWDVVRELDAGFLEHHGPSVVTKRGWLGTTLREGPRRVFEFAWLPEDEAAEQWRLLRLSDADF
ncbi:hypothetical protein GCM10025864_01800 [Luteimicrobium album]|uniref:Uncharacterized protein n=1 Tax=Luteimicrobium album TaxID=1054550 RepID=A0ABQ6HVA7_9MICO|nr:hypothetical protein [Luteimicrobium album]GMA22421.1 hypothetical protein GCM10025864_01800 [Luteimicrobium album]